ncbi:hypothetical protein TEPIDINF_001651 [Tepidibacillus infernus]|uniref:Uncharacterized protein n=1 Tax=Tepidibacillus decaturensis TaxID=1413211 RepID=A0A135L5P0_9BACI|nr:MULTISPECIES: hypothetical protein [Tepidibacillus]KXG44163.1 hypothetical protein U473_09235 [Tepidibacillus decaturensis]GBF10320.1 hypothetical protein HK1_00332 [Tepidibacillus sp. HK-1]
MSYICPVCNGLMSLEATCPHCHHQLDDFGRIDQLWGPYSPYREINELRLINGYPDDEQNHQCIHITSCPACGQDQIIRIDEIFQG